MKVSVKLQAIRRGGHWHVSVWSSEFGPETTHGRNGDLVLRGSEWAAFRLLLERGSEASLGAISLAVTETDEA